MTNRIADFAKKTIGDKRRWRVFRSQVDKLPTAYGTALDGLGRYLLVTGPGDGDAVMQMLEDLADLFETAAADDLPVRQVVGDDPVEFAETFKANYGLARWQSKEQQRLIETIHVAEQQQ